MLNGRPTKIKCAKNLSEQRQDDLKNPYTSPKIWKKITLLAIRFVYMHLYMYSICMIYIYIYIHLYIITRLYYIYIYAYVFTLWYVHIKYMFIWQFVSKYIFSHAIHDQVFNFPYRSFSSLWFVVNKILIEHKAT